MAQNNTESNSIVSWYKKQRITIKGAIISGLFVIVAAVIPSIIEEIRPNKPITVILQTSENQNANNLLANNSIVAIPISEVDKVFPIFVGNSWTYKFGTTIESGDEQKPLMKNIGYFTETIITVETSSSDQVRIVNIMVTGENYMQECNWGELYSGESELWYVIDSTRIFQVCNKDEAYKVAKGIINNDLKSLSLFTPEYEMPLEVGNKWPAFPDTPPRNDHMYQWFVESIVDENVPAGQFINCYRIELITSVDSTIHWICPGTGLVAKSYKHNGATVEYRAELNEDIDYHTDNN